MLGASRSDKVWQTGNCWHSDGTTSETGYPRDPTSEPPHMTPPIATFSVLVLLGCLQIQLPQPRTPEIAEAQQ
jgi:hypothetical protein